MSILYRSKEGDTLDEICYHYYGKTNGAVEQVLIANPGLASLGAILPLGTIITLPDIQTVEIEQIDLWQ